ncbi:hypothetical protein BpHYR1_016741 [Brachionus plicatilis]|uniref:Uncharacterized protein n=1 Tax=Brachionus plicatilis TaxID=10195 RepID=A0A3M7Q2C9_BRAPC|nr:hypothetical protein BpHYR1_016741 [Brachionus plicatilis]
MEKTTNVTTVQQNQLTPEKRGRKKATSGRNDYLNNFSKNCKKNGFTKSCVIFYKITYPYRKIFMRITQLWIFYQGSRFKTQQFDLY